MSKILCLDSSFLHNRVDFEDYCAKRNNWATRPGIVLEPVFCHPRTREEFLKHFEQKDVLLIVNTFTNSHEFGGYTDAMIRTIAGSGVRAICQQSSGYDSLGNAGLWKELGVTLSNCPESPARDTANTTIFLLIGAVRQFGVFTKRLYAGQFNGEMYLTESVEDKTLGILGMGNIGRIIRDKAQIFNPVKTIYHQRRRLTPELELDAEFVPDLDTFLGQADIIILVAPYNESTHHIINRERLFNKVKPGAFIINVGRGPLIDEDALVDALNANKLGGVGLDVYEHEPKIHPGLLANERAFLLPHMGGFTFRTFRSFEKEVLRFVRAFVEEGKIVNQVN